MNRFLALIVLAAGLSAPAWAETRSVTLSVPGMTCAACPITVKRALRQVPGVESVDVDLQRKQARFVFDDASTSVQALTQATGNAGYPSSAPQSGASS